MNATTRFVTRVPQDIYRTKQLSRLCTLGALGYLYIPEYDNNNQFGYSGTPETYHAKQFSRVCTLAPGYLYTSYNRV